MREVREHPVKRTALPSLLEFESKTPLVVFLVLALTIGAVGYVVFAHFRDALRQDKYHELTAIADLKVSQIAGWLDERRGDAAATTRDPILAQVVQRWLQRGAPHDEAGRSIESRLQGLREAYSYDKVILLDRGIRPALVAGDALHQHAHVESNQRAAAAMSAGQPLLSDLHLEAEAAGAPAQVNIDLYAPLLEDGRRAVGSVYFQINPYRFLFPFIQSWPTPSRSAETLLVRRDGDDVLYLNELRHRKDSALRFRLPLNASELPAARSLRGETGVIQGVDYRDIPVLAALRTIPGTSWHLVAKIDQAEVFAPTRDLAIGVGAMVAVLIAGAGLLVALWWRKQHAQFLAMHFEAKFEREALSKHLDLMSRHANDAIFLYDEAGRILEANERAVERYGYTRDELIGMSANQLRAPEAAQGARAEMHRADEAGSGIYEMRHRRKDGGEFPVEASLRVIEVEGRRRTQGVIRDISERKQAEAALRDSEERYRVIAESASDVIVAIDEDSRITFVNPASENVFGYAGDELIGQSLTLLIPENRRSSHLRGLKRYVETGRRTVNWKSVELFARHKSGKELPVEISFGEFLRDGKRFFSGIIRDITARKQAEARIARLAQLKDALSGVNHAIVHAETEQALFDQICSIMVTRAGFDYAGIGIADPESGEVNWAAHATSHPSDTILAKSPRSVHTDQPEGRGPTGTAIRERRHVVVQDYLNDPLTAHWQEMARKLGIGSSGFFPIMRAGAAVGTINVYSKMVNAFDEEAIALLDEAAQDVSFSLDNLDREAALRAAEEQFRGLVEQSISGIYIIQDGRFAYVNPRAAEIFGYAAPEELIGREPVELVAEKDRGLVSENIRRRLAGEVKSIAYTFTGLRKDGATVEIGAHGSYATYRGRPAIISAAQDITERKRAEEEAQRYLVELQQAMMATVRVASTMGEMRDPYTSGHERRVGELSAAIGAELGLPEHQVEGLRVAGFLHDLGKIKVPAEILSKPGKISPAEYTLIKEHAQQGYEILKEVNFPWPVALVALQHHERLDGSGYPQGLKGDQIILEARILAVADTVEAMASHRPYRPGLGIDAALAEIEKHRDSRYDPQAVDTCLHLFRDNGYRLPS